MLYLLKRFIGKKRRMEKLKVKKEAVLLIIILLAGFALRVWGINFGLPYILHQDESIVVNHAMAYGAGDLNPHFFAIPPLTSYLLFIIYGAYFLIGRLLGIFQTAEAFALSFLKDPTIFFILGRLFIGAIPGTLCVFFTFMLYKRLFKSAKGALFAASIMALSFLNVLDSHYIYTDMLMTLFVVIGVMRSVVLWEKPSTKNYIYAGIVLGISAGIKYNAAILVVPCIIAHIMASKSRPVNKNLCIGILSSIVAFILVNPFSVIDFKFFISSVLGQAGASGYVGWTHHITYSLYEGIGIFTIIAGFLGMIALFLSNKGKAAILLSFPAVFYIHLVFLSQHFPRYVLPLIPFFAIATGYFIFEYVLPMIKSEVFKKIVISLSIIPIIVLSIKPINANVLFTSVDTRIQAAEWIERNIKPKDPIAFDHTFFRPFIYHN
jgi:4-amino-4-deoxy-L-arabinose transferase-like glycosyltransferase